MSDDPDERNPLAPYYPSEVPVVPGGGRRWPAIALLLVFALGLLALVVTLIVTLP